MTINLPDALYPCSLQGDDLERITAITDAAAEFWATIRNSMGDTTYAKEIEMHILQAKMLAVLSISHAYGRIPDLDLEAE